MARLHSFVPFPLLVTLLPTLAAQTWTSPQPATAPPAAIQCRMAYDGLRARTVLFGGWAGVNVHDDTWEWDGASWTLQTPAARPPERDDHGMTFDSNRGRTVLWGGEDLGFVLVTSTWEWDGTNWAQVATANTPPGRLGAPLAFDSVRNRVVMFGGTDWATDFADTWEYDGVDWTQRTPVVSPPARGHHGMAFHAGRGRTVLFGGDVNGTLADDTWAWDGTSWVQLPTDGAPAPRVDHTMAYDPARQRIVLFGGADQVFDLDDTWEFDGAVWYDVTTRARPAGTAGGAGTFDAARGDALVYGGYSNGASASLWRYGGQDATYRTFGRGCAGGNGIAPRLEANAVPALGAAIDLDFVDLPAAPGVLILEIGLSNTSWFGQPLPMDLGNYGMPGCRNYTSADANFTFVYTNTSMNFQFAIPANPAFAGLRLYHQLLVFDLLAPNPAGLTTSNAGEATLH